MNMRQCGLAGLLSLAAAASVQAQAQDSERCFLQVEYVGDAGRQATSVDGVEINYYAGGGVRFRCRGTPVRMSADSVASINGGRVVYFIGKVRYRDSSVTLDADRGTYFKDGERWEARGNVKTSNLESGSTLEGPSVDYYRRIAGLRDTVDVVAVGRTKVRYVASADSGAAAKPDEPYLIVADRMRLRGDDLIWAGGKVTVDRSDLAAAADSMALDTRGGWQEGVLIGARPTFRAMDKDTVELRGSRIDFGMDQRELRVVTAIGDAEGESRDRILTGKVIRLHVRERAARRTLAWGERAQAEAQGESYAARGDALTFASPNERLEQMTALGDAWVGAKADSGTTERDWVAGDTVVAEFRELAGETGLDVLVARGGARAYYRGGKDGKAKGALAYVRGDRITVRMQADRDEVHLVDVYGHVDGVQLEPKAPGTRSGPSPGRDGGVPSR